MSKHHIDSLICPECGSREEITIWETINDKDEAASS